MRSILKLAFLFLFVTGFSVISAQCPSKGATCCPEGKASEETVDGTVETSEVQVYYFHATRRCATCMAVEEVTKEALTEYYGDKIVFKSLNLEEDTTTELAKKYEVAGQTLLVVSKDENINLTNFAFMNARTNPDKLKEKIKETIDSVTKA